MYRYGSKQPSADYCAALYVKFNVVYAEIFLLANELFTLRSHNVYYMDAFSWNDASTYISALFSTMISLQLHTTACLAPLSMLEFTLCIPILWKFLCKCFMVCFWKKLSCFQKKSQWLEFGRYKKCQNWFFLHNSQVMNMAGFS